jgi:predicted RNA-binding protein with PIN domain
MALRYLVFAMPDYSQCEHLILDGYNLIHAIPEVRDAMRSHGITVARERFQELTLCLHDPGKVRLTIVYDGQGGKIDVDQPIPDDPGYAIVYSPSGVSADEVIERLVTNADSPERILVATKDHAIAQTFAASGAFALTPDELLDRIQRVTSVQTRVLQEKRRQNHREWGMNPFND